jgi:hypothetical protein
MTEHIRCAGSVSLWDYTVALGNVVTTKTTAAVATTAARQFLGLYDQANGDDGATAVYVTLTTLVVFT